MRSSSTGSISGRALVLYAYHANGKSRGNVVVNHYCCEDVVAVQKNNLAAIIQQVRFDEKSNDKRVSYCVNKTRRSGAIDK